MEFLIADTFTDSLARLTGEEQKSVKTTAFDLQLNPAGTSMSFHKLDRARDKNFRSVRASRDIRLIVHRTPQSLLLCYVDHHDAAYDWAERRRLETHPKTGAAQLVEIRERVEEVAVPQYVQSLLPHPKRPLFAELSDEALLTYGVPSEWLEAVRQATEDTVLDLADHLPREAAEALLEVAVGGTPAIAEVKPPTEDSFAHPDAQRRFRVVSNVEELTVALEYPWEKWAVFLHPAQREAVERDYGGPARVSGTAGTGKTIVALHRAVYYLARKNPEARILLTTFSTTLANALRGKLRILVASEPAIAERVEVHALNDVAVRLYGRNFGPPNIATRENVQTVLEAAVAEAGSRHFSARFWLSEWQDVVDAWQLGSWEQYRDIARLGRKTRLPERQRAALWKIFEQVRTSLREHGLVTYADLFEKLTSEITRRCHAPYDYVVVDEAQDVSVPQLRFLAAVGAERPNGLFFAGDLGQRIFQQPFSWRALGVDVRGRSRTLRINYRTSHQIRSQADRLLGPQVADVDGVVEDRRGAISVFNGPDHEIRVLKNVADEREVVGCWLTDRLAEEIKPHEVSVFVRSAGQLDRARNAVKSAGISFKVLDEHVETTSGYLSIGTMHLAKGLEFRIVVLMACDDEIIPLQERLESVGDDADLEEVYNTERHLLYVACTRDSRPPSRDGRHSWF